MDLGSACFSVIEEVDDWSALDQLCRAKNLTFYTADSDSSFDTEIHELISQFLGMIYPSKISQILKSHSSI